MKAPRPLADTLTIREVLTEPLDTKISGVGDYLSPYKVLLDCDNVWRRVRQQSDRSYYVHKDTGVYYLETSFEPTKGDTFKRYRPEFPPGYLDGP